MFMIDLSLAVRLRERRGQKRRRSSTPTSPSPQKKRKKESDEEESTEEEEEEEEDDSDEEADKRKPKKSAKGTRKVGKKTSRKKADGPTRGDHKPTPEEVQVAGQFIDELLADEDLPIPVKVPKGWMPDTSVYGKVSIISNVF
jgi:hypothetical protein